MYFLKARNAGSVIITDYRQLIAITGGMGDEEMKRFTSSRVSHNLVQHAPLARLRDIRVASMRRHVEGWTTACVSYGNFPTGFAIRSGFNVEGSGIRR